MRTCLVSVEIFAWGKYRRFGRAVRMVGRELARHGHKMLAVVPKNDTIQSSHEAVFGMNADGPTTPRISVVIPTRDNERSVAITEALAAQTLLPLEVIWVHDLERRGPAWARNRGIEQAVGEMFAFLDDDCVPPETWLSDLSDALIRHRADGAGGTYVETDPFLAARRSRQPYPDRQCWDPGGLVGTGGNVMYTRAALEICRRRDGAVFDERFRISQDKELAWRLRRHGGRLVFVPTPVTHLKSLSPWAYVRQQFGRGRGIAALDRRARLASTFVPPDRGLLWDRHAHLGVGGWMRLLWRKGLGPFDVQSFSTRREFALFWAGEKMQALGYLAERVQGKYR